MPVYFQDLIKFIRTVSRLQLREKDRDYISEFVKRDVPWQSIADMARIEGVEGLLYRHLKAWDTAEVPENIVERFENTYRQTRDNMLQVTKTVRGFSDWFAKLGISVIALQGLSLLDLYGDPGLRVLSDVDFLVRPSDKKRVKILLRSLGYIDADPWYPDILFGKGIWIDLHTHVLNLDRIQARRYLFPESLGPMWKRALPLFDYPTGIMRPDPFDNFITLSAHALKHSYSRLIWLVDLNESLLSMTKSSGSWMTLVERSKMWSQKKVVLYALCLIEHIFGTLIPEWVKRGLGFHRLNIIERHLLRLKLNGFSVPEFYVPLLFFAVEGFGKKAKLLEETLFPRKDVMDQIVGIGPYRNRITAIAKRTVRCVGVLWKLTFSAFRLSFRSIR